MALRYHQKLVESLDADPASSKERADVVASRAKRCRIAFPAAVVEWFSLDDAHDLFRDNTNADELVPLDELGDPDEVAKGYLRVAVENQGVIGWYVALDGSADPPVVHNDDDWDSPLDEVDWVECADHFSEFLREIMLEQ